MGPTTTLQKRSVVCQHANGSSYTDCDLRSRYARAQTPNDSFIQLKCSQTVRSVRHSGFYLCRSAGVCCYSIYTECYYLPALHFYLTSYSSYYVSWVCSPPQSGGGAATLTDHSLVLSVAAHISPPYVRAGTRISRRCDRFAHSQLLCCNRSSVRLLIPSVSDA